MNDDGDNPSEDFEHEPNIILDLLSRVFDVFTNYGWFILVGSVLIYWLYLKYRTRVQDWMDSAELHRNPDKFIQREESVASARLKLQEKYNQMAADHAEKEKEKEEKRRSEARAKGLDPDSASEESKPKKSLKPIRPEYNPLMADTRSGWLGASRRRGGG